MATALPLLDPLLARLLVHYAPPLPAESLYQVPAFTLAVAILVALPVSLPPTSRGRSSFGCFSPTVSVILAGYFVLPYTSAWRAFAAWFPALPLT